MIDNTCGCRMSWTYRSAVMVPRIHTKGDLVLKSMETHTIILAVREMSRYKAKSRLRRSPSVLHKRTRLSSLLRLNLDSSLKLTWFHSTTVQFPPSTTINVGVDGWASKTAHVMGTAVPNVLQPGTLVWF
ncbi:e3 ubiquitin-protein ligase RNF13 [Trichonephila clavipes]|uniref:E3 ubiquitin-protein ligase RNF13 n=1 Tax=Trichonephila clavipes TaxID=2585209 RepID=A0A8X6VHT5_TRICX|nr:e3 ubiquitin-protein ligase RNF13 [Trichonephila clavipes]